MRPDVDIGALADLVAQRLGCRSPKSAAQESEPLKMTGIHKKGGTFRVDTTIQGHRVFRSGFKTRALAAHWAHRMRTEPHLLSEYLKQKLARNPSTVADLLAWYERQRKKLRSFARIVQYRRHLERHVGDVKASDLRQTHINAYTDARSGEGSSPKNTWNELAHLRAVLNEAWRCDLLNQPPRFRLKGTNCARKRVAYEDEAALLIQRADEPLRCVVLAAWSMGLRRSEILEARWDWVHGRDLYLPADYTKTSSNEVVTIPGPLWDLLARAPRHSTHVFCRVRRGTNGRSPHATEVVPWAETTLRRQWEALCNECGVRDLKLHDLRRSMSTVAQNRGHTADAVRQVGRWSDERTMQRHYSHAPRRKVLDVSEDLARLVLPLHPVGKGGEFEPQKMCNNN